VRRAQPEQVLQRQIAQFLAVALDGNSWFSSLPLGGGGKLRGAILHGLGVKRGLPDMLVVNDGRVVWLELKSAKGRISEGQQECHAALARARCPVAVVRSLEDAIDALQRAGVPLRIAGETTPGVTRDPLALREVAV
jgi:hypothetical protein